MHGIQGSEGEFKRLNGARVPEIVKLLQQQYGIHDPSDALISWYRQSVLQLYSQEARIFPHAREILEGIKRLPAKLFLVTSAEFLLANAFLQKEHLNSIFDGLVTGENVEKGKPCPDIYLKALQLAEALPEFSIAIEDSPNGLEAARRAGIHQIALAPSPLLDGTGAQWQTYSNWLDIGKAIGLK
jgi:HAD superfamily hydrolase (TIGR01509 family)